jgi:hypothetical protein
MAKENRKENKADYGISPRKQRVLLKQSKFKIQGLDRHTGYAVLSVRNETKDSTNYLYLTPPQGSDHHHTIFHHPFIWAMERSAYDPEARLVLMRYINYLFIRLHTKISLCNI